MFRDKFWFSLALTIPTLIWGHMLPRIFGYAPPRIPGGHLIPPVFGTAVYLYGGWPFVQGAWRELEARLPGMMTLIALAITVAFGFSLAATLGYPGMPLWEELATLVAIMRLGHWIEMRSIALAQGTLAEMAKLLPDTAVRVVPDGTAQRTEEVPVAGLRPGDLILVRPGARVPAHGTVREGHSSVNESVITGEARPVEKNPDERVIAATVNGTGSLRVEVTGVGDQTMAGIMPLVRAAGFEASPGYGVRATVDGRRLAVGGPILLARLGIGLSPDFARFTEAAAAQARSVVYLVEGEAVAAAFAVADAVARELGIGTVLAQVLPEQKAAKIEELRRQGKGVAMVGDGVNEAPALVTADVGIAIGAGTDVAVEAGDVVLIRSDPRDIPRIVALSRATYRKMVQNLWWASGYDIVAIPLAAGVLARAGILLTPAMGAVLMSLSAVIVAVNAQLLRRERLA